MMDRMSLGSSGNARAPAGEAARETTALFPGCEGGGRLLPGPAPAGNILSPPNAISGQVAACSLY
jgi:hypothetical protein